MPDSLTFIGNATTIIRLGGFTLLTDPNFLHRGQRAYLGKGLWTRRLTDPACSIADLPPLNAIVLSHLHGDHFDRVARAELDREPPLITTPAAAQRLQRYGFRTHGLESWTEHRLELGTEQLTVHAVPGFHARGLLGMVLPPVMGSVLEHRTADGQTRRILISGDTLTGDHVDEIRERFGHFDTAIVHLGGTRVLMHTVTMDAVQGVDYLQRARPGQVIPVHYDDYRVFRSPLADFEALFDRSSPRETGMTLTKAARGQTVDLLP
ncbi:MBL fold metallo-hydrolase [Kineosporia rhizophila]|uniref:MBL fold metallo-hydrolase n=1 Tax=Kineosporia rhizophila TaxID=84633 RepID=UPI001E4DBC53|nr:MBL fold metallo-hydrolase [Kineosporia rhizophila]